MEDVLPSVAGDAASAHAHEDMVVARRKARARQLIAHARSAQIRKSGTNITRMSDAELKDRILRQARG